MAYAWFEWSLLFLAVWVLVFATLRRRESRREMWRTSLWTSLFGLMEPLFVPAYWRPPSLFDLAARTRFDLESFLFCFAVGGLAVALYERIASATHRTIAERIRRHPRFHRWFFVSGPLLFAVCYLLTPFNPIYDVLIGLYGGGLATLYCRPDLARKMLISAAAFGALYFACFVTLNLAYPGYVARTWNLSALSGVLVAGVPIEEVLFGVGVGFYWSSIYDHLAWRRVKQTT